MTAVVGEVAVPLEADPLAGLERAIAIGEDRGEVDEEDLAVVRGDPSVSLLPLEPADRPEAAYAAQLRPPDREVVVGLVVVLHGGEPRRRAHEAEVYPWCMGRTNIDLDDDLVRVVMRRYGLKTKKDAVDFALRRLVGPVPTRRQMLELEGVGWDGDLDAIRDDSVAWT